MRRSREPEYWQPYQLLPPVLEVLNFVDTHDPIGGGECLLVVIQLEILVADLHVACAVETIRLAELRLERAETVVAQLVPVGKEPTSLSRDY